MKKYTIGEVSKRLGLSRDTLRFYEKKGIITPEKKENGYRQYTYEDTRKLLDIMFFRRLNFSIDDIDRILHRSSYHSYCSMIQEKIEEEQRIIAHHRRTLIHLQHVEQLYKNIELYLNKYDIRPLRRYYKMDESNLIDKLEVFDLCYIYQEYLIGNNTLEQIDEYLLFSSETASIMNIEEELKEHLFIQQNRCFYTVIASSSHIATDQEVLNVANWAVSEGYELLGTAYSGFLLNCAVDDIHNTRQYDDDKTTPVYYIELYLPIKEA
jgi:DNA-binding transcriptional MerR regulator